MITSDPHAAPVASRIRATHPNSYRSGQWAELLTQVPATGPDGQLRECFLVRFPDGNLDWWVCDDERAGYEFEVIGS